MPKTNLSLEGDSQSVRLLDRRRGISLQHRWHFRGCIIAVRAFKRRNPGGVAPPGFLQMGLCAASPLSAAHPPRRARKIGGACFWRRVCQKRDRLEGAWWGEDVRFWHKADQLHLPPVSFASDPKRTFQRRWRCHSMGEHAPLTLVAITFLDARSSIESVRRDAESPLPAHRVCRALALGLLPVGVSRSGRWVSQLRKHRGHAGRGNRLASSIPALRLSCAVCLLPSRVRLLCDLRPRIATIHPRMTSMRLRPPPRIVTIPQRMATTVTIRPRMASMATIRPRMATDHPRTTACVCEPGGSSPC